MKSGITITGMMALVAAVLLTGGCEKVTTTSVLVVTPPSAVVAPESAVAFTVSLPENERDSREVYYPLTWTLSDATLGSMTNTAANTAIYVAGSQSNVVNTVIVRDQSGAEGMAVITQQ